MLVTCRKNIDFYFILYYNVKQRYSFIGVASTNFICRGGGRMLAYNFILHQAWWDT